MASMHAKSLCDVLLFLAIIDALHNLLSVWVFAFYASMHESTCAVSLFSHHVHHVVMVSAEKQMSGIHTSRIVALVQNMHIRCYFPIPKRP